MRPTGPAARARSPSCTAAAPAATEPAAPLAAAGHAADCAVDPAPSTAVAAPRPRRRDEPARRARGRGGPDRRARGATEEVAEQAPVADAEREPGRGAAGRGRAARSTQEHGGRGPAPPRPPSPLRRIEADGSNHRKGGAGAPQEDGRRDPGLPACARRGRRRHGRGRAHPPREGHHQRRQASAPRAHRGSGRGRRPRRSQARRGDRDARVRDRLRREVARVRLARRGDRERARPEG